MRYTLLSLSLLSLASLSAALPTATTTTTSNDLEARHRNPDVLDAFVGAVVKTGHHDLLKVIADVEVEKRGLLGLDVDAIVGGGSGSLINVDANVGVLGSEQVSILHSQKTCSV